MSNEQLDKLAVIYFSKDRPLQLDLALSTNKTHCKEGSELKEFVIYKASGLDFLEAYTSLSVMHPLCVFIKEDNFKANLLDILSVGGYSYVMFVVDDTVFTSQYSINDILTQLDNQPEVLGFSLRLGRNTKICYPISKPNDIPYFQTEDSRMLSWDWRTVNVGDFSYPLEVSSSVYRLSDLQYLLEGADYKNPNELEWVLSLNYPNFFNSMPYMLCYETSVAFSNPINKVQNINNNRAGVKEEYSTDNLLTVYQGGWEIDPRRYLGYIPNGCHQEVELHFVKRGAYDRR